MTLPHPNHLLAAAPRSVAEALVGALHALGVREAFGVPGGALVPLLASLAGGAIRATTARHESGAVFMAAEASLATGRPTVAYVTTGPGLTNALTGALSARDDGASVLLLSGMTPAAMRGRHPIQDTSRRGLGTGALHEPGLFDDAWVLEDPGALESVARRLAELWARPQGAVVHLAVPLDVQGWPCPHVDARPAAATVERVDAEHARTVASYLGRRFALWVGHGGRGAARSVRALAEAAGLPVVTTPRGRGVLGADHPLWVGVSGMGGDADLPDRLREMGVERLLVLGSRLGEMATGHVDALVPPGGLVHVDVDPTVPGASFPAARTVGLVGDVGAWCRALLPVVAPSALRPIPRARPVVPSDLQGPVRPPVLLDALQRSALDRGLPVHVDAGNAISWSTRYLRPRAPGQLRVPGSFGSMACATTGSVGRAIATGRPVVALVGDGAMLMQNELSTAVERGAAVIFVVLNDSGLGMVSHGMAALGRAHPACGWPSVDFAAWGAAQGAWSTRVAHESELTSALDAALASCRAAVIDVVVDRTCPPPFLERIHRLASMTGA
jgi:acetolactate synthase-1/2/3 large subunit